jgi:hypothetical protein
VTCSYRLPIAFWGLAWLAAVSPAWAWNEAGHELVGLLASGQLSDETYQAALEILRTHPVLERHFFGAMPSDVWRSNSAEKDRWLFCHAGQWPDMVKGRPPLVTQEEERLFDRPEWHYLDIPIVLAPSDEITASIAQLNSRLDLPSTIEEAKLNAVQAVHLNLARLRDKDSRPSERAIALCWLSHLVADLHQPCHAASFYSPKVFPTGDRGANSIQTSRKSNLHALWDRSLLDRTDFSTVRAKAARMARSLAAVSEEAASAAPEVWLAESHALAEEVVYNPAVREQLTEWESKEELGELVVDAPYLKAMRVASQQQAAIAARRLAALIQSSLVAPTEVKKPKKKLQAAAPLNRPA